MAVVVYDHPSGARVRWALVRHHNNFGISIPLHCSSKELQRRRLIPLVGGASFQYLAFVINCSPEIVSLAADVGFACLRLRKTSSKWQRH